MVYYRLVLVKIVTKLVLEHDFLAMLAFRREYVPKFKDTVNAL